MLSDFNSFGRCGEMVNRSAVNIFLSWHLCVLAKWFFFGFRDWKSFFLCNNLNMNFEAHGITCKSIQTSRIAFKQ